MSELKVTDLQRMLREMADTHGVDIISTPGMVSVAGKSYGHVAPNLDIRSTGDTKIMRGFLEVNIPHENTYLTQLNVGHGIDEDNMFKKGMDFNMLVPGREILRSRKSVHSFQYPKEGRLGPYSFSPTGSKDKDDGEFKNIHDLLGHISSLPRPEGWQNDYDTFEGNFNIPIADLKDFDIHSALEHSRRRFSGVDMPKGTEHLLAVVHHHKPKQPNLTISVSSRYLYDPRSEKLIGVPQSNEEKW